VESPDVSAAMGTTFKASGERIHFALLITLSVACATNLLMTYSWLYPVRDITVAWMNVRFGG
jgi:hypothetical protein